MKTRYPIILLFIFISFSCRKQMSADKLADTNISGAQTDGPVKMPKIVYSTTTKTQFIANADGNGTADFTLSFAAKQPGISITSFTFLAYETDSSDALSIKPAGIGAPVFFSPTSTHGPAKAIAAIDCDGDPEGFGVHLPDDGSPVSVTFTINYGIPTATGGVKSGDTVSIQLSYIEYEIGGHLPSYAEAFSMPLSPEMMITGSKPFLGLNIYDVDSLHLGLTRILELEYSSIGGSLGINNLPLIVTTTNTNIRADLVVKDETNQVINTTTLRNKSNYTIQFPKGYKLNGINAHNFYVYAHVYKIDGQACINASLQRAAKFSWTDIAGGKTTPYTIENATYYRNYPNGIITVTHN